MLDGDTFGMLRDSLALFAPGGRTGLNPASLKMIFTFLCVALGEQGNPCGTSGNKRNLIPVAAKMGLLMAGATAMMGVSPAPAGGRRTVWNCRLHRLLSGFWTRGKHFYCVITTMPFELDALLPGT